MARRNVFVFVFFASGLLTGVVGMIAFSGGGLPRAAAFQEPLRGAGGAAQPQATPTNQKAIRALQESRLAVARQVYEEEFNLVQSGVSLGLEEVPSWSLRWMEAQIHLANSHDARLAAMRDHLVRMRVWERLWAQRAETGEGRAIDAPRANFFRIEAEQRLVEAGGVGAVPPIPPGGVKVPELDPGLQAQPQPPPARAPG